MAKAFVRRFSALLQGAVQLLGRCRASTGTMKIAEFSAGGNVLIRMGWVFSEACAAWDLGLGWKSVEEPDQQRSRKDFGHRPVSA